LFVQRLPISAEPRAAIDASAPFLHLTYLATKRGTARSYKSLTGESESGATPPDCRSSAGCTARKKAH
jgi:hypothetical protein